MCHDDALYKFTFYLLTYCSFAVQRQSLMISNAEMQKKTKMNVIYLHRKQVGLTLSNVDAAKNKLLTFATLLSEYRVD